MLQNMRRLKLHVSFPNSDSSAKTLRMNAKCYLNHLL